MPRNAPRGRLASLAIEDAGDDFVRIMSSQPAKQGEGIFIGGRPVRLKALQRHIQFGNHAAPPTQRQIGTGFLALHVEDHFFQQRAQKFLAIPVGRGRRRPDETQIGTEKLNSLTFFCGERARSLLFSAEVIRLPLPPGSAAVIPILFPDHELPVYFPALLPYIAVLPVPPHNGHARLPVATATGPHPDRIRAVGPRVRWPRVPPG